MNKNNSFLFIKNPDKEKENLFNAYRSDAIKTMKRGAEADWHRKKRAKYPKYRTKLVKGNNNGKDTLQEADES